MANATAKLTINAEVLGLARIKDLSKHLQSLGRVSASTGTRGLRNLERGLGRAATSSVTARSKFRSLEQELARLQLKSDQERITKKARLILDGPPGPPRIVPKLKSVNDELLRLQRIAENRAITQQARGILGRRPGGILEGHGFVSQTRKSIGLMRDVTVAGLGIAHGTRAAAAGVMGMINPLRQLDLNLARVKVKGGFNDQQMGEIAASTAGVSKLGLGFGQVQASEAAIELAASGLNPGDIAKQLPNVLKFAQSGELSTESAAGTLVKTASQFGLDASEFGRIGDVLKQGADISTISVDDLRESMSYVGPIARAAGVDLEQTTGILALLGQNGIEASMGGTALRSMFTSLVNPTKQQTKALRAMGMSAKEARDGLSDLPSLLALMSDKLGRKGFSDSRKLQLLSQIFGERGVAPASILLEASRGGEVDKFVGEMGKAKGAMDKAAEVLSGTIEGRMKNLSASFEGARIKIATAFLPALEGLLPKLQIAGEATGNWVSKNSELTLNIGTAVAGLAGFTVVVQGLTVAFGALQGAMAFLSAPATLAAMAGLAAYAGTTALAGRESRDFGGWLYDKIHGTGVETSNIRGSLTAIGNERPQSIKEAVQAERASRTFTPGRLGPGGDPVLQAQQQAQQEAGALSREPWAGHLQIEINSKGEATVAHLDTSGADLDVGTTVAP